MIGQSCTRLVQVLSITLIINAMNFVTHDILFLL